MKLNILSLWLILFLLVPFYTQAQAPIFQKSLKVYTNLENRSEFHTDWLNNQPTTFRSNHTNFGNLSFAFNLQNDLGHFHEFELSQLYYRHTDESNLVFADTNSPGTFISGGRTNSFGIALRYERGWQIFKKQTTSNWSIFISGAVQPYYNFTQFFPITSQSFPTRTSNVGANLFVVPRVQYHLNDKWSLDLNIPLQLAQAQYSNDLVENPSFGLQQQRFNTLSFESFPPVFHARFGVGYKFVQK